MSEPYTVTINIQLEPAAREEFLSALPAVLKETAGFPGFVNIRASQNATDPNRLIVIETWESQPEYEAYLAWRVSSGTSRSNGIISRDTQRWAPVIVDL